MQYPLFSQIVSLFHRSRQAGSMRFVLQRWLCPEQAKVWSGRDELPTTPSDSTELAEVLRRGQALAL
jgi:hypothetical protein